MRTSSRRWWAWAALALAIVLAWVAWRAGAPPALVAPGPLSESTDPVPPIPGSETLDGSPSPTVSGPCEAASWAPDASVREWVRNTSWGGDGPSRSSISWPPALVDAWGVDVITALDTLTRPADAVDLHALEEATRVLRGENLAAPSEGEFGAWVLLADTSLAMYEPFLDGTDGPELTAALLADIEEQLHTDPEHPVSIELALLLGDALSLQDLVLGPKGEAVSLSGPAVRAWLAVAPHAEGSDQVALAMASMNHGDSVVLEAEEWDALWGPLRGSTDPDVQFALHTEQAYRALDASDPRRLEEALAALSELPLASAMPEDLARLEAQLGSLTGTPPEALPARLWFELDACGWEPGAPEFRVGWDGDDWWADAGGPPSGCLVDLPALEVRTCWHIRVF